MALTSNQNVTMFATYNGNPIDVQQTVPLYNITSHNSTIESDTRYWGGTSVVFAPPPPPNPLPPMPEPQSIPTALNNPTSMNNPIALNYIGKENVRTIVVSTPNGNFSLKCNGSQMLYVSGASNYQSQAANIAVGTYVGTSIPNGTTSYLHPVISNTVNVFSLVSMYEIQYSTDVVSDRQWLYVNNIMVK